MRGGITKIKKIKVNIIAIAEIPNLKAVLVIFGTNDLIVIDNSPCKFWIIDVYFHVFVCSCVHEQDIEINA